MNDPHANQPLRTAGADAASFLQLAGAIDVPYLAWLAPQAAGGAWYPQRFIAPSSTTSLGCPARHLVIVL